MNSVSKVNNLRALSSMHGRSSDSFTLSSPPRDTRPVDTLCQIPTFSPTAASTPWKHNYSSRAPTPTQTT